MSSQYLGAGGRLTSGPAPELIAAGYAAEVAHGPFLAHDLSRADLAHAVALAEAGEISSERATALITGLLELHAIPGDQFPWDPELGDAFNSREHVLTERVGPDAAGWLSAGRPRREAFRVALRLLTRSQVLALQVASLDAAAAMAGHAKRLAHHLGADYTYLQPAQPTTVGHLLLSYVYPALRDAERLRRHYEVLDLSVAGAGGSAGSRWGLDRRRLAELLGCSDLVPHVRDAMWQTDVYVDVLSTVAISATHQSQMAQDFEILASREFDVVRLADRHSRASALMPQKRNPYALAVIREAAGAAAGDVAAVLTTLHTGSARTDHFHALNGVVPRRLDHAIAVTRLAAEVVDGMEVDAEKLAETARAGFTVAADVADVIAKTTTLDYRRAHKLLGLVVRRRIEGGMSLQEISPEDIASAAREQLDMEIRVDPNALASALDPAQCARERLQEGSSAPDQVDRLLSECDTRLAVAREWTTEEAARLERAEVHLVEAAERLAA